MLKKLHLYLRALLSRASNINSASVYSLFVTSMVACLFGTALGLLILFISNLFVKPNSRDIITMLTIWIVLSLVYAIIRSFSYIRVSNSMVYSRRSRRAYMNIKDPSKYRSLNYIKHKTAVSDLVKKEFIEGIQKVAAISPGSPISAITHKWVIENVIDSPEVQQHYLLNDNDKKVIGKKVMAQNVLLLVKWDFIRRNEAWFIQHVLDPIVYFKIKLTVRH